MNATELETRVGCLDPQFASEAQMIAARNDVAALGEAYRRLRSLVDTKTIEWIDTNGRDLVNGDQRFYVGTDRKYVVADPTATYEAVFEACGGDVSSVTTFLSANAFKPGACRKILGDKFDAYFQTVESKSLETGKAKRVVKMADAKYADKGDE